MAKRIKSGIRLISEERIRQIEQENFSLEHDAQWTHGELVGAAICYLAFTITKSAVFINIKDHFWKWHPSLWKPQSRIRNLVCAGALIAAEIDRIQTNQSEE